MSEIPYTPFEKLNLTYKLENYPSHTPLSQSRINKEIADAFAKWQDVSPFTFSPYTSGVPDIKLSFSTVTKPNEHLAETRWDTRTTVFSDRCNWVETADPFDVYKVDVLSVAVHEIGHVLGLYDNNEPRSVMSGSDYNKRRTVARSPIPQVDIDKLKSVYPSEFSQYYASQGKITWWEPAGSGLHLAPDLTSKDSKFIHVSAGIDNTVWAIDNFKRTVYELGPMDDFGNVWAKRAEGLTRLAVFNEHLVLGTGIFKDPGHPRAFEADDFFDLKRYDRQTQSWINVSTGGLQSGTKLGLVAVDPGGSVWAIAALPNSRPRQQIVRYEGDIIAGTGDWKVVPTMGFNAPTPFFGPAAFDRDSNFLDLAVGRRNGKPWIWVTHANSTIWSGNNMESQPLDFFASNDLGMSWHRQPIPPGVISAPTVWKEKERYLLVGKCVSVSDDGTVVRVFKDSAYRFDGSTWTQLPGQFIDVSVISKTNMWAANSGMRIRSTIVTHRG